MRYKGLPASIPESEFSEEFVQGMADRSATSFYKYGSAKDAFPNRTNALESAKQRIKLYRKGGWVKGQYIKAGNTEYLMDAANFLMFEFMYPAVRGARFEPTDSSGSPGRVLTNGEISEKKNIEEYQYTKDGD